MSTADLRTELAVSDLTPSVRGLLTRMLTHDPSTHRHLLGVGNVATALADRLDCAPVVRRAVRVSALLHDIGKLHVPTAVLAAPRALTPGEWSLMRRHPELGAFLARRTGERGIAAAIRSHHERIDGRGYPDGLRGSEIPFASRIIAVADAYDVLVSGRPYRAALDPFDALQIIVDDADAHFDPEIVTALVRLPLQTLARPA